MVFLIFVHFIGKPQAYLGLLGHKYSTYINKRQLFAVLKLYFSGTKENT
jgi:hypothetical protein